MKKVIIVRHKITNNYSLGRCYIQHEDYSIEEIGVSLERGWKNNQNNISCIPNGEYKLRLEHSPKFNKDLWEIYGVPNRSECKFHVANYWRQLNGCIALGKSHIDLDGDSDPDVNHSKDTLDKFHSKMTGVEALLIVKDL